MGLLLGLQALSACHFILDFSQDVVDAGPRTDSLGRPIDAGSDGGGGGCVDPTTWYADADRDGFGDAETPVQACAAPAGYVADANDCDDAVEGAHPGAVEACNGADDDCNLILDDGACLAGCADGVRDGFLDTTTHTRIAACSGGFSVAGVQLDAAPACDRHGGDDGTNPNGTGCRAADLCAAGWHVCASPGDVALSSGSASCAGSVADALVPVFFATRQSGPGSGDCGAGANDIFGCGNLGAAPLASCAPLDRFSGDLCGTIGPPWSCGPDNVQEAVNVVKSAPQGGGVLCCRDPS